MPSNPTVICQVGAIYNKWCWTQISWTLIRPWHPLHVPYLFGILHRGWQIAAVFCAKHLKSMWNWRKSWTQEISRDFSLRWDYYNMKSSLMFKDKIRRDIRYVNSLRFPYKTFPGRWYMVLCGAACTQCPDTVFIFSYQNSVMQSLYTRQVFSSQVTSRHRALPTHPWRICYVCCLLRGLGQQLCATVRMHDDTTIPPESTREFGIFILLLVSAWTHSWINGRLAVDSRHHDAHATSL